MVLPTSTFQIKPNIYDGKQRLSDPDGTYTPPPAALEPVANLTLTGNTNNSQTMTWTHSGSNIDGYVVEVWVAGVDTGWREVGSVGPSTYTWTTTGLPAETYIRHRVAAGIASSGVLSAWQELDATTEQNPASGGTTDLANLTFFYNFEHLSHGDQMQDRDGFGACQNFSCDTSRSVAGSRCGHTFIDVNSWSRSDDRESPDGPTGFRYWGYKLGDNANFPKPYVGCEVWWRQYTYWPSNAIINAGINLKQFRMMKNDRYSGAGKGGTEVGISAVNGHVLRFHPEGGPYLYTDAYGNPTSAHTFFGTPPIQFGAWNCVEVYNKMGSTVETSSTNVWINGVAIGPIPSVTFREDTNQVFAFYMGTYWNNGIYGAGGYQEQWYDQIAIAMHGQTSLGFLDDRDKLSRDAAGHLWIGLDVNTVAGAGR